MCLNKRRWKFQISFTTLLSFEDRLPLDKRSHKDRHIACKVNSYVLVVFTVTFQCNLLDTIFIDIGQWNNFQNTP